MEWRPSAALRVAMAARVGGAVGVSYVLLRFFFPQVLLLPVLTLFVACGIAVLFLPCSVVLDRSAGEVEITYAGWERRVALTQIERTNSDKRFGFGIDFRNGMGLDITPFGEGGRLERWLWLRFRTGFEGMEPAIAEAAAAARAANPDEPAARQGIVGACLIGGVGLIFLAAAVLVRPQVNVQLVHSVAWLLSVGYGILGSLAVVLGASMAVSAWRARAHNPS
jgi:hypothetical protein